MTWEMGGQFRGFSLRLPIPTPKLDLSRSRLMAIWDVEQSLQHLLPTVPSPHPPLLTNTASAIRNLSRSKVPLRSDEEPARAWLASFVAAERWTPDDGNSRLMHADWLRNSISPLQNCIKTRRLRSHRRNSRPYWGRSVPPSPTRSLPPTLPNQRLPRRQIFSGK